MPALRPVAAAAVLAAVLAAAAGADPWPRFRGPDGAGVAADQAVPVKWTEADYLWKAPLPGAGHSSPVVWGDKVFVTSGRPSDAKRFVVALGAADGRVLWTREYDSARTKMNSLNSYGSASPAADAERVYVCWAGDDRYVLAAIDHAGRDVWSRDLGPFKGEHGHGASPAVVDGLVIVADDQDGPSFALAVDPKTGETRWKLPRKSARAAYATPCVFRPAGGPAQVVFASDGCGLTGVDPRTGAVVWEAPGVFPKRVVGSPVAGPGIVLGTCGEGGAGFHVIAVRPCPAKPAGQGEAGPRPGGTAEEAWRVAGRGLPYVPTPVVKGDLVFLLGDGGVATCLRASTGEKVWQEPLQARFYGSPIVVGDRLYAIARDGTVFVLAAGEKFELLATNPLGEASHATPAVADGRLYLRTVSHLVCLGPAKN